MQDARRTDGNAIRSAVCVDFGTRPQPSIHHSASVASSTSAAAVLVGGWSREPFIYDVRAEGGEGGEGVVEK